jgi:hypothetical protein
VHHRGRYVLTCTIATFRLPPNNAASPTPRSKRVEQSLLIGWHLNPCQGVETSDRTPHSERAEEVQKVLLMLFRKPIELLDHCVGF